MSNFLLDYLEYNKGSESPELFNLWCGLGGISCALGRRCWLDLGRLVHFPNLYIVLVAGSGRMRKSTSVQIIEELLRQLEPTPNLIAQKITPEALIDALRIRELADEKILLREKAEGFVICDELASFLNKYSYEAGLGALLTSFWDCKAVFEYRTKGGGSQKLVNTCLGILGASTVDWLTHAVPESAVGGGVTSRIVFVYVQEPPTPVPWPERKDELKARLLTTLQRITCLEGPFMVTPGARAYYEEQYVRFNKESKFFDNKNLAGYASRRFAHWWRVAMLLCASECTNMTIRDEHVMGAEAIMSRTETHMPLVLELVTASEQGNMMFFVRDLVWRTGRMPKRQLLAAVSHKLSTRDLDVILETLTQSGQLRLELVGNIAYYVKSTL